MKLLEINLFRGFLTGKIRDLKESTIPLIVLLWIMVSALMDKIVSSSGLLKTLSKTERMAREFFLDPSNSLGKFSPITAPILRESLEKLDMLIVGLCSNLPPLNVSKTE